MLFRSNSNLHLSLFSYIWLRTDHAWYRLENPSMSYRKFFCDLAAANCLCCTIFAACYKAPHLSWDAFLEKIPEYTLHEAVSYASNILGAWSIAIVEGIAVVRV